jgi:hypothetical protein
MEHWFDALTKRLVADDASRRSFITTGAAAFAAAVAGMRWVQVFAAAVPAADPHPWLKHEGRKAAEPKTIKMGPCAATAKPGALEHRRVSTGTAGGLAYSWEAMRTHQADSFTVQHTLSINGKQQLQLTWVHTSAKKTLQMTIGDAFGYKGANITSDDGGKTLRGTIDGREIHPFVKGPGKKPQFVDGKSFSAKVPPGHAEALKALAAASRKDLATCTAASPRAASDRSNQGDVTRSADAAVHRARSECGSPSNWSWVEPLGFDVIYSQACANCANNCCVSLWTAAEDVVGCILGAFVWDFSDCSDFVNLSSQQVTCLEGCNGSNACHSQLCGFPAVGSWGSLPSCDVGYQCVGSTGYCCQDGYPTICPGYILPGETNLGSNVCCRQGTGCLTQPQWYLDLGDYVAQVNRYGSAANGQAYGPALPKIPYEKCCPTNQICGVRSVNANAPYMNGWYGSGECCKQGQTCAESIDPPLLVPGPGVIIAKPITNFGQKVCCEGAHLHKGKCCTKHWCGDNCCASAGECHNGQCCPGEVCDGKCCAAGEKCQKGKCCKGTWCGNTCCDNGKTCGDPVKGTCAEVCLSGAVTTDGKCCGVGQTACGKQCCAGACQDASTSTCGKAPPQPKTPKCKIGQYVCSSQLSGSSEIKEICCPEGGSCFNGKCCPRSKAACTNSKTGEFGCWAPSLCAPPPVANPK